MGEGRLRLRTRNADSSGALIRIGTLVAISGGTDAVELGVAPRCATRIPIAVVVAR